ncbi:hypothetical protein SAMN00017405_0689 [Desulfonispora thiosulfatigenes DSM 11270]|uniref:Uncharacterized protein n=1 Tax=Desulfonispora thiosulfatigenes DSM 11270 TaxID=656914 RepID=A0A1W1VAH0_DESTI|nr:hypothetical protein [Desulfonispora thiosulfatigenes]SMB89964.1 hypothetical protein SAMN00017405_0689 [Desulfonispora thiosulfatigenes DSM 11270]
MILKTSDFKTQILCLAYRAIQVMKEKNQKNEGEIIKMEELSIKIIRGERFQTDDYIQVERLYKNSQLN